MKIIKKTNIVVIGGGPAGYSAAFRCADLGLKTILIERFANIGGVCLNVGCIPSKFFLHIIKIIKDAKELKKNGVIFNKPYIDIIKLREYKEKLIYNMSHSLNKLRINRKIDFIQGEAKFIDKNNLIVIHNNDDFIINFNNAIIATGSYPILLPPFTKKNFRIWDTTDALSLKFIPKKMLILGAGICGLEIATIYNILGSKIDILESSNQIINSADLDVVNILYKQISLNINIILNAVIIKLEEKSDGIYLTINNGLKNKIIKYDVILMAIGRKPNSSNINLNKLGIKINKNGFILTDNQMRTNINNIYAIGDVIGPPMLAHKGIYQAHLVSEIIFGKKYFFDTNLIPFVAYTNPEVAWVGITEKEAIKKCINYEISIFPWSYLGRAIVSDCNYGITKLIFNKDTNVIIGGSIVGINAGELIGEITLAIEMGCNVKDITLTIHAHPTLYESISLASQIYDKSITDMLNVKK